MLNFDGFFPKKTGINRSTEKELLYEYFREFLEKYDITSLLVRAVIATG